MNIIKLCLLKLEKNNAEAIKIWNKELVKDQEDIKEIIYCENLL